MNGIEVFDGDWLVVQYIQIQGSMPIRLSGRMVNKIGEIIPLEASQVLAAFGNEQVLAIPLVDGKLLAAQFSSNFTAAGPLALYGVISIRRGPTAAYRVLTILSSGYCGNAFAISWPHKLPQPNPLVDTPRSSTTPSNPAAGAGFTFSFSGSRTERVEAMSFTLTTDATVANRLVVITIASTVIIPAKVLQPASSTVIYTCLPKNESNTAIIGNRAIINLGDVGWQTSPALSVAVDNIQATDQISAITVHTRQIPLARNLLI